jgi:hypothetical protein
MRYEATRIDFFSILLLLFVFVIPLKGFSMPQNIQDIIPMLSDQPNGVGIPITNRDVWEEVASSPVAQGELSWVQEHETDEIPHMTEELYKHVAETGEETPFFRAYYGLRNRLVRFVIAECITNTGRYLPQIERMIQMVCDEPTWIHAANDRQLQNYYGKIHQIDLIVALTAWQMATIDYLLGDRLESDTRRRIREEIQIRAITPYLAAIRGEEPLIWWLTIQMNWNAVCISGVTGAILTLIDSKTIRAEAIRAAMKYLPYYLKGFLEDGYCPEGLAYWNFGFSHFLFIAQMIRQETDGVIDLFANDFVKRIARFPINFQLVPGIYPTISDCSLDIKPQKRIVQFLNNYYDWGITNWEGYGGGYSHRMYDFALLDVQHRIYEYDTAQDSTALDPRHWFDQGEVYLGRAADWKNQISVCIKAGHNGDSHGHHDVGMFMVVIDDSVLITDPGKEDYYRRTFSPQRFESGMLNSFGHSVPIVADSLQSRGRQSKATVLETNFSDSQDRIVLDLRDAYQDVSGLLRLERSFTYTRGTEVVLEVTDEVQYESPQLFEVGFVTYSEWESFSDDSIVIFDEKQAIQLHFEAAYPLRFSSEDVSGHLPEQPRPIRIHVAIEQPLTQARIRTHIARYNEPTILNTLRNQTNK